MQPGPEGAGYHVDWEAHVAMVSQKSRAGPDIIVSVRSACLPDSLTTRSLIYLIHLYTDLSTYLASHMHSSIYPLPPQTRHCRIAWMTKQAPHPKEC